MQNDARRSEAVQAASTRSAPLSHLWERYLALFALAISLYLLLELYLPAQADYSAYMVMSNLGMSVYLFTANFLVIRGRPWGSVADRGGHGRLHAGDHRALGQART